MNRIKELRINQGMTLLQLSEKLGVSESTVQRYESGNIKNLKYETMVELARIFGSSPCHVMGWEDEDSIEEIKLTDPENHLLALYKSLNQEGQEMIIKQAEALVASGLYNISDQYKLVEKEA